MSKASLPFTQCNRVAVNRVLPTLPATTGEGINIPGSSASGRSIRQRKRGWQVYTVYPIPLRADKGARTQMHHNICLPESGLQQADI
jgi:hypothetical protein